MTKPVVCLPTAIVWLTFALLAVCPFNSVQQVPNKQWKHIGCFVDSFNRILPHYKCVEGSVTECPACAGPGIDSPAGTGSGCQNPDMTVDLCLSLCSQNMHVYAGLESGNECYCGNADAVYQILEDETLESCKTPCDGNGTQTCGGTFWTSVYDLRKSCIVNNLNSFITPSMPTAFDNVTVVFNTDDTLTFSCQSGYTLSGQGSSTCQEDGSWIPSIPTCIASDFLSDVTCQNLTNPSHGTITPSQTEYRAGQSAKFTCMSGYVLKGSFLLTCGTDGQWNSISPTCTEGLCPEPVDVDNGKWVLTRFERNVGVSVIYVCLRGFKLSSGADSIGLVCNEDFEWEGEVPVCIEDAPDVGDLNANQGGGNDITRNGTDTGGGNNNGRDNGSNGSPPVSWIIVLSCIVIAASLKHGYCTTV